MPMLLFTFCTLEVLVLEKLNYNIQFTCSFSVHEVHVNSDRGPWQEHRPVFHIIEGSFKRQICVRKLTQSDLFAFFSWKFKLPNILGNRILFLKFISCFWLTENASWPFFTLNNVFVPPKTKGTSFQCCKNLTWPFAKWHASVSLQCSPNFWGW